MNRVRRLVARNKILNFNQAGRDRWVEGEAARIPAGSRVLDVGAGASPYRSLFAHCTYHTQDSATLLPEQSLGRAGYGKIDFVCDCTEIPVPDAAYDVVICTEVLEHVARPVEVLQEIARVLRPGGTLLLTAPLGSGLHQEPLHFYGGFTPHFYEKVLPEAGIRVVSIEPNGGFFRHYGQESLRFAYLTAPWRRSGPRHLRLLAAAVWPLALSWVAVAPLLGALLDPLDERSEFTVGYHVVAVRDSVGPSARTASPTS